MEQNVIGFFLLGGQFFSGVTEISSCQEYAIVLRVMGPVHEKWSQGTKTLC